MLKHHNPCENQFEDEPECQPVFKNSYYCQECGEEWDDEYPAQVDDDCPGCGRRHLSPHTSVEVAPCACDCGYK